MKKITSAVLMLSLFTLLSTSCKKDSDTKKDEKDLRSTKLSFKLDGTNKTSTHLWAIHDDGEDYLAVQGTLSNSESINIVINDFNGNGEFDIEDNEALVTYTNGTNTATNAYIGTEGVVKITSINGSEVKGTFSGTVNNLSNSSKTIAEGKFEAQIVEETDLED